VFHRSKANGKESGSDGVRWRSLRERSSARTKLSRRSARTGWARSTARDTKLQVLSIAGDSRSAPKAPSSLSLLSMIRGRLDEPLMSPTAGRLDGFAISSDGRWLAYQSNESGQFEVYVRPFPRVNDGRWVVSKNGGTSPVWSKRGDELFYFSAEGQLMSAAIRSQPDFSVGEVKTILANRYLAGAGTYDVSPDGQRFLVIKNAGAQIVVVENWFEELKAKVPAGK
jgi:Tol biopolymer transport system component